MSKGRRQLQTAQSEASPSLRRDAQEVSGPAEFASLDRPVSDASEPTDDEIRAHAYERYLRRGAADGYAEEDWLAAERELRGRTE